jgi:cytochrome c oxidase accessory protein FixG
MPLDNVQGVGPDDAVSTKVQKASIPLYANRIKVYPKAIAGTFRRIKWVILAACLTIYYVVPWIRWDRGPGAPDQAVLLDLAGGRGYFFGIEIWAQEIYYLTGFLILAAIGLFLATSLFGRVWCGYACPQTVWTDLFMWVERLIEGDRNARMKLDQQPASASKALKKVAKHGAWLLIAVATGGAWVFYFADAPTALRDIFTLQASVEMYFFVGLFTATTYTLAGWAREQVCTYMCPWPRFQAAMLDENSVIVTYAGWRGEPRGKHKAGTSWDGRGDCVDCRQCVAVCPTGIDIRDGQQLECIGCGLCIDACAPVMAKIGRPANLISFDTLANQSERAAGRPPKFRFIRARTLIYSTLLVIVAAVMLGTFVMRSTVELNVLRDRAPLFVTLSDGSLRNGYTLKILNKQRGDRQYALQVAGIPGAVLTVVGQAEGVAGDLGIALDAKSDSVATFRLYVAAPRTAVSSDSTPITFTVRERQTGESATYSSVFMGPPR